MDGEIWGDARVTYPDWKGTAQLDERMTVPWEGLARTVGLDRDQWQVIGFSIGGGEHKYHLRVYATPRDVWEKVASDDEAGIEVTEFLVHDVDPLAILQRMTHVFELNMRIRGLDKRQVRVRALSDLSLGTVRGRKLRSARRLERPPPAHPRPAGGVSGVARRGGTAGS